MRYHAKAAQPRTCSECSDAAVEQSYIPSELVDDVAREQCPLACGQKRMSADELGDYPAALDIADQHDWDIRRLGKPHIGDVSITQIDFGRAPRPFDEDEVSRLAELIRAVRDAGATVILVEHNFGLVLSLADDIHVLARGRIIASGPPSIIEHHPVVLSEYLGTTGPVEDLAIFEPPTP